MVVAFLVMVLGQEWSFRKFTPQDGLSHNTVYAIHQDQEGFLWLGTFEVVNRFDGLRFRIPDGLQETLPRRVRRIIAEDSGGFWMATHTGAWRHGSDGFERLGVADGLADDSTYDVLLDSNDRLWIATRGGVNRQRSDGSWDHFDEADGLPHVTVRRMLEMPDGSIWMGSQAGLIQWQDGGFQAVDLPGTEAPGIYAMAMDTQERLWVGTDQGLFCREGEHWFEFREERGLPSPEIWALYVDAYDRIWVGSDSGVVTAATGDDDLATLIFEAPANHEIAQTTIYAIESDRQGNLWFGTCIGLFLLHEPAVRNWRSAASSGGSMVLSLAEDPSGEVWLGTDRGVLRRRGRQIEDMTPSLALPDLFVRDLHIAGDGTKSFATRRGILIDDGNRQHLIDSTQGLPPGNVLCLEPTADGSLLIGMEWGGLGIFKDNKLTMIPVDYGPGARRIYAIAVDPSGFAWIGTDGGLHRYANQQMEALPVDLPGEEVTALLLDDKQWLWIGTDRGVAVLENGRLRRPYPDHTLAGAPVRLLLQDSSSGIWIGTTEGLVRVTDEGCLVIDGSARTAREMNFGAALEDRHGQLWFGHFDGMLQVDRFRLASRGQPPAIYLAKFSVFGQDLPIQPDLSLNYRSNQPQFTFTGLDYQAPDELRFEYRLVGYQHEWHQMKQRQVGFQNLPPGDYRFLARVKDRNGLVSRNEVALPFKIKPPFWDSWWFRTGIVLAILILVIVQINHLRLRNRMLAREAAYLSAEVLREKSEKLQQQAELKLLQSQMNPHFLQNAFANALYFVRSSPDKAERMIQKLSTLFRASMQAKDQALAPLEAELRMCADYLDIQKLRFGDSLTFQIPEPGENGDWIMPAFVLQPLVENAVIHGRRDALDGLKVDVLLEARGSDRLVVTVRNNGQPFERPFSAMIKPGHALDNIRKRLALLGLSEIEHDYRDGCHHVILVLEAQLANHHH